MSDSFARPNFNKSCTKCQIFDADIIHYASLFISHIVFLHACKLSTSHVPRDKNHRHATYPSFMTTLHSLGYSHAIKPLSYMSQTCDLSSKTPMRASFNEMSEKHRSRIVYRGHVYLLNSALFLCMFLSQRCNPYIIIGRGRKCIATCPLDALIALRDCAN